MIDWLDVVWALAVIRYIYLELRRGLDRLDAGK